MTRTNKTTQQAWKNAPEPIVAILSSEEFPQKVDAIGSKYNLNDMELGFLQRITTNLMLGTLKPVDFISAILDEIDVGREKAAYIAQDINRDVFSPVKDALKELHHLAPSEQAPMPPKSPLANYFDQKQGAPSVMPTPAVVTPLPIKPGVPQPSGSSTKAPEAEKTQILPPAAPPKLEQKLGDSFRVKVVPPVAAPSAQTPTRPQVPVRPQTPPPAQTLPPQVSSPAQSSPAITPPPTAQIRQQQNLGGQAPQLNMPPQWTQLNKPTPTAPGVAVPPKPTSPPTVVPAKPTTPPSPQVPAKPRPPVAPQVPQKPGADPYREQIQ